MVLEVNTLFYLSDKHVYTFCIVFLLGFFSLSLVLLIVLKRQYHFTTCNEHQCNMQIVQMVYVNNMVSAFK